MSKALEIDLASNGEETKLRWKADGPYQKPIRLNSDALRKRSKRVRDALGALNDYVRTNTRLQEDKDAGWLRYQEVLSELQEAGRGLKAAILNSADQRTKAFSETIANLPPGTVVRAFCSDTDVTVPLGFVYDGIPGAKANCAPSFADFDGFWRNKFSITMLVEGGDYKPEQLCIDPTKIRTLYALNKTEVENSYEFLGAETDKLAKLSRVKVGTCYDWESMQKAWKQISAGDNIVFIFAHSDGDSLKLASPGAALDSLVFSDILQKETGLTSLTLLVMNCCLSISGSEGGSLLSAVARQGFCGVVGTEAEILNSVALRCGTRLMWEMCAHGKPLGVSLDEMQKDPELFPLNLLYTCYADRDFKLSAPIAELENAGS